MLTYFLGCYFGSFSDCDLVGYSIKLWCLFSSNLEEISLGNYRVSAGKLSDVLKVNGSEYGPNSQLTGITETLEDGDDSQTSTPHFPTEVPRPRVHFPVHLLFLAD